MKMQKVSAAGRRRDSCILAFFNAIRLKLLVTEITVFVFTFSSLIADYEKMNAFVEKKYIFFW